MADSLPDTVERALRGRRVVLAVSGGRDSMSLAHAALARARATVACLACFDHATGPHATDAVALVRELAAERDVEFATARADATARTEAAWRAQRWTFLRRVARQHEAQIATAHTYDDQVETVLMRVMRGAGARGLAALAASSDVIRPFLSTRRRDVAAYAVRAGVRWVEDPGNARHEHLRNRIRHDLLPALARADPRLPDALAALAQRAAVLRTDVDRFLDRELEVGHESGAIMVDREMLLNYDAQELALLWPALAARAGATLDRRGTERLVAFTINHRNGARIQLSGGFEAVAHRGRISVRKEPLRALPGTLGLAAGVRIGGFRFDARDGDVLSLWSAKLPAGRKLTVRAWHHGDRMIPAGGAARRVKGLLRDAGVDAASRNAWPVVLADDEIVWVPGVRRSSAASARSGRPVVTYHCERLR